MIYIFTIIFGVLFNKIYQKIFLKKDFIDEINHRSSHITIATRSGGLVLFSVFTLYILYLYFNKNQPFDFSILIPISILFSTGLYDDIYGVDYGLKFIFQIIAAKLMIDMGLVIDLFSIFGYEFSFSRFISQVFTVIVYIGIFNAYNFIDGIDGNLIFETLKNIVIILILFNFSKSVIELIFVVSIVLIVILSFNLKKDFKVFMGDSGSLILPILLIYLIFLGGQVNDDQNIMKFIIIIFLYPIIDIIRVVLLRLKNNKSPFNADKNHIHHIINKKFNNHILSALSICCIATILQLTFIFVFL